MRPRRLVQTAKDRDFVASSKLSLMNDADAAKLSSKDLLRYARIPAGKRDYQVWRKKVESCPPDSKQVDIPPSLARLLVKDHISHMALKSSDKKADTYQICINPFQRKDPTNVSDIKTDMEELAKAAAKPSKYRPAIMNELSHYTRIDEKVLENKPDNAPLDFAELHKLLQRFSEVDKTKQSTIGVTLQTKIMKQYDDMLKGFTRQLQSRLISEAVERDKNMLNDADNLFAGYHDNQTSTIIQGGAKDFDTMLQGFRNQPIMSSLDIKSDKSLFDSSGNVKSEISSRLSIEEFAEHLELNQDPLMLRSVNEYLVEQRISLLMFQIYQIYYRLMLLEEQSTENVANRYEKLSHDNIIKQMIPNKLLFSILEWMYKSHLGPSNDERAPFKKHETLVYFYNQIKALLAYSKRPNNEYEFPAMTICTSGISDDGYLYEEELHIEKKMLKAENAYIIDIPQLELSDTLISIIRSPVLICYHPESNPAAISNVPDGFPWIEKEKKEITYNIAFDNTRHTVLAMKSNVCMKSLHVAFQPRSVDNIDILNGETHIAVGFPYPAIFPHISQKMQFLGRMIHGYKKKSGHISHDTNMTVLQIQLDLLQGNKCKGDECEDHYITVMTSRYAKLELLMMYLLQKYQYNRNDPAIDYDDDDSGILIQLSNIQEALKASGRRLPYIKLSPTIHDRLIKSQGKCLAQSKQLEDMMIPKEVAAHANDILMRKI